MDSGAKEFIATISDTIDINDRNVFWNIIGNTPLEVFDSSKETEPNLINPGDTVKFKQISLEEYKNYNE